MAYGKAGKWMKMLEDKLGVGLFDKAMQEYYNKWKFKHPQPEDFKQSIEEASNSNLDAIFSLLHKKEALIPTNQKIKTHFIFQL